MATVSADVTEWLSFDGTPLDTPAWETVDLGVIYGSPQLSGSGQPIAQRVGEHPHARLPGPKRIGLPMRIFGDRDSDGNPWSDPVEGLRRNTEELHRKLRPRLNVTGGVATLTHHLSTGATRDGPAQLAAALETGAQDDVALRAVARLWLPDGGLADSVATSASATDATSLVVANPGTADQLDMVVTLSGDATSVTLTNPDWGDATDLTVAVDLSAGDVTVDTGEMTATQSGASVIASVSHTTDGAFPMRWLPLIAGQDNTLGISHNGTTLTVTVDHNPRWQ